MGQGTALRLVVCVEKTIQLEHEDQLSQLRLQQVVYLRRDCESSACCLAGTMSEFGVERSSARHCPWTDFRPFWSRLGFRTCLWCCDALPLKWLWRDSPKGLGMEV